MRRGAARIALLTLAMTAATSAAAQTIPRYTIEDQFGREWTPSDFHDRPMVYVICDREGYEYSENWTKPLVAKFKDRVRFIAVADVRGVPGFLQGWIKGRFRDEYQHPVLLDWDGILPRTVGFTDDVPNLALVDRNGRVIHRTSGTGTTRQIDQFSNKIARALQ